MARKTANERKSEIIGVTLRLLESTPIEALSTNLVAQEVGITQAAIFRHFPTKDALWVAVLEEIERTAQARWTEAAAEAAPHDCLRAVLLAQLGLIADFPAVPAIIFNAGKFAGEDVLRPIHLRLMSRFRSTLLGYAGALIKARNTRAEWRPEASDIADLLMGLIQGTVLRWSLSHRAFDLTKEGARLIDIQIGLIRESLERERT